MRAHLYKRFCCVMAAAGMAMLAAGAAQAAPVNIDAFSAGDAAVALSGFDDDFDEDTGLDPAQTIGGMRELHACSSSYIGQGEYMTAAVNAGEGTLIVNALDDVGATLWLKYGTSVYGGAALNADWSGLDRIELAFAQGQEPAVDQVVDIGLTWNWTDQTQFSQGGVVVTIPPGAADFTVDLDAIIDLDIADVDGLYVCFSLPGGDAQSFALDSIRVVPEPGTGVLLLVGASAGVFFLFFRGRKGGLFPVRPCMMSAGVFLAAALLSAAASAQLRAEVIIDFNDHSPSDPLYLGVGESYTASGFDFTCQQKGYIVAVTGWLSIQGYNNPSIVRVTADSGLFDLLSVRVAGYDAGDGEAWMIGSGGSRYDFLASDNGQTVNLNWTDLQYVDITGPRGNFAGVRRLALDDFTVQPVPEPASAVLALLAAVALLLWHGSGRVWNRGRGLCSILFLAALASTPALHAAPGDILNLGTLPGGGDSGATGINDAGAVVGHVYQSDGENRAFLHRGTSEDVMVDLGTLPGCNHSYATAINNDGAVAGLSGVGFDVHAFLLRGTPGAVMEDLGTLGGYQSYAKGINDAGVVAGVSHIYGSEYNHAFRHPGTPGSTMEDLGTLPGGSDSCAYAINNDGAVVGYSKGEGYVHAFLHRGTSGAVMEDLETLGGDESWAYGINDAGVVVGTSQNSDGNTHAFLHPGTPGGTMQDLGALPRHDLEPLGNNSVANDINNRGGVVGSSWFIVPNQYTQHAVLWLPNGTIVDLEAWLDEVNPAEGIGELVDGQWHAWSLREATAINDQGIVAGWGAYSYWNTDMGDPVTVARAFRLDASTLVPEPGTGVLLLVGASAVVFFRFFRGRGRKWDGHIFRT